MYRIRKQAGWTFIGVIFSVIPLAILGYIIMKAVPPYLESFSVGSAVNSLKKDIDLKDKPKEEIYKLLQKRFEINDVHSVEKDHIKIQKTPTETSVTIDYESRVPLFSNIALAFTFHKSVVLR